MATPFIEAPIVRTDPPVSGGINTSAIDKFRQGVFVKTDKHRSDGVLLGVATTRNLNHQIEPNLLGQEGGTFALEDTAFVDREKWDAKLFVESTNKEIFSAKREGPFSFDGVLEPLEIRRITTFDSPDSVEAPFFAHSVKGNLQGGNEDENSASEMVIQFIELEQPTEEVPWIDSTDSIGEDPQATIKIPGVTSNEKHKIAAFNDSRNETLFSGAPGDNRVTNSDTVNVALRSMTGSIDQDLRPAGHKSSAAGFTYDNNGPGTDSLAFGGLIRS
jgi:hypothetical protein